MPDLGFCAVAGERERRSPKDCASVIWRSTLVHL
jgi:hypothetical protein